VELGDHQSGYYMEGREGEKKQRVIQLDPKEHFYRLPTIEGLLPLLPAHDLHRCELSMGY